MNALLPDILDQTEPTIRGRLSLRPFVNYLHQQKAAASTHQPLWHYLADTFAKHPALLEPTDRADDFVVPNELNQLLALSVLPLLTNDSQLAYAFGGLEPLEFFYRSDEFRRILSGQCPLPDVKQTQAYCDDKFRFIYQLILEHCYHVRAGTQGVVSFKFACQLNGVNRHYKMQLDTRFMTTSCTSDLPPLQPTWVDFVNGKLNSVADLPVSLPLDLFHAEGFCIFMVNDVTSQEVVNNLKETLLHLHAMPEPRVYQHLEQALQTLTGKANVQIGLMPFIQVNGRYVHHPEYNARSIFFRHCYDSYTTVPNEQTYAHLVDYVTSHPQPQVISDLSVASNGAMKSPIQWLYQQGLRSFAVYPMLGPDGVLGVLEMGSTVTGALTDELLEQLNDVIPLVKELLLYQISIFNDRIRQIIRQQFTALQPAVEWKFIEAAWQYLQATSVQDGAEPNRLPVSMKSVAFRRVHPIYGAIDVRNSSQERHNALFRDLNNQFEAIDTFLNQPGLPATSEALTEFRHKTRIHWDRIRNGISSQDEINVSMYLADELNPFLQQMYPTDPATADALQAYADRLDSTGQFSEARQEFETALQQINTALSGYLASEVRHIQTIYPHFFEKYRTDGLEYNLYVGQSLAPDVPFLPEHLNRLRFWQLNSMVSMAMLTHQLQATLPIPLQTTQLLLAHIPPVDISFRQDEQRFDAEGAYSIRYEVIKKRIDKALVKGTHERLTQPDTLALVYLDNNQINEYIEFIYQLQEYGRLQPGIEFLELDTLQGVSGLKALRVRIAYDS